MCGAEKQGSDIAESIGRTDGSCSNFSSRELVGFLIHDDTMSTYTLNTGYPSVRVMLTCTLSVELSSL